MFWFLRTTVRLGELDLNPTVDDGARPIDVPVDRIVIHAKYHPQELTSDIALLKLKNIVTYNGEFINNIAVR